MTPFHPTVPGLHEAIMELIDAVTAETHAFRTAPSDKAGQKITDAAVVRVMAAESALLSFDKAAIEADIDATGDMDYMRALALAKRRWLVMEGLYESAEDHADCLLLDLILGDSEPFNSVPLLWHISGKPRDERPTDAELQAGWK